MFLAINEIKDAKLRYSLIVGLLTLVSYLMYFLSKKEDLKQQYKRCMQEMKEAQLSNDAVRANQLMIELVNIQKQLKKS